MSLKLIKINGLWIFIEYRNNNNITIYPNPHLNSSSEPEPKPKGYSGGKISLTPIPTPVGFEVFHPNP
jgi:hypothetical protein